MRNLLWRATLAAALSGVPISLAAQEPTSGNSPATLSYVEGRVDLDQQGVSQTATAPSLLVEGDRLRTRDGRAEIVFADGSLLHADRDTTLEWLGERHVRLLEGRVLVRVSAAATSFVIDTPPGAVRLDPRGEYDVSLRDRTGELEVSVARGVAEVGTAAERLVVRGGEAVMTDGSGRPSWRDFNSARFDAFSRWSYERSNGSTAAASSRYLPSELRTYGPMFDQQGRWDYAAPYGYVWYPSVAVAWRPYYHGSWRHTRYGWTWYGQDRWAWPTHHFGRWGFSANAWFWIPGKVWGPAWVSWGFSPGFVSWCPLGWDGRPVVPFWPRPGFAAHGAYDPWRAWNVMPRGRFGDARPVQSWIVNPRTLPNSSRNTFVVQSAPPPSPRGYAVPRGTFSVPTATRLEASDGASRQVRPGGAVRRGPSAGPAVSESPAGAPSATGRSRASAGGSGGQVPAQSWQRPRAGLDNRPVVQSGERPAGGVRAPRPERSPTPPSGEADQSWSPRRRSSSDDGAPPPAARRRDDPPPQTYAPPPSPRSRGESGGSGQGGARNPRNGGGSSWDRPTRPSSPPPDSGSSGSARSGSARSGGAQGGGAVRRPR